MTTAPALLTIAQAARVAGIGRNRMGRVVRLGQCTSLMVGGKRMVAREQVEAWMAGRISPPVRLDAVRAAKRLPVQPRRRSNEALSIIDAAMKAGSR